MPRNQNRDTIDKISEGKDKYIHHSVALGVDPNVARAVLTTGKMQCANSRKNGALKSSARVPRNRER
jgi:hypothetical protein